VKITGATLTDPSSSSPLTTTPCSDVPLNDALFVSTPDPCVSFGLDMDDGTKPMTTTTAAASDCNSGEMTPDVLTDEEREFDEFLMDAVQWL